MNHSSPFAPRRQGRCVAAVALMLSLWLALGALEVSPALHRFLHQDAQSPGHNCQVTQLQHHGLLAGLTAAVSPPPPAVWGGRAAIPNSQFLPAFDYAVSDGRAPPSSFSSTAVGG